MPLRLFLVRAAVVGQNVVGRPVLATLHDTALQSGVAQCLNGGPIQAGNGGQADVLGDDALGDAERGSDPLMGETGFEFKT